MTAWKKAREQHAACDFESGAAGDENGRQFQNAVRSDKAPELESHAGFPGCRADYTDEQSVKNHHPDGAEARGDAERERAEGDGKIIGHDAGGREGLDSDDGMGPHFAALDGFHHVGAEQAVGKAGVMSGYGPGSNPADEKNCRGEEGLRKRFAKNLWIRDAVEADDGADFRFVAVIYEVVAAAEKLI